MAVISRILPQEGYTRRMAYADFTAGLTGAVAGAPQAMGFALLAGVSPLYGLYTAIVSTIFASLLTRSHMMTVGPTNALALVVGSTLLGLRDVDPINSLFLLTFLVGAFQLVFGLLRLGRLTRFVSNAVMTGFITGAGLLIMLGQLSHLTGHSGSGDNVLFRTLDWLGKLGQLDPATTFIGLLTVVMIYTLHHTRLKNVATLIAILVTSLLVAVLGWTSVETVADLATIPQALPELRVPDFSALSLDLLTAALAMAVLASVQSAALVQAIHTGSGSVRVSRDFSAQGIGNLIGAFFQGMPAGGSLSRTAVNIASGAQTRAANILSGVFIALSLLLFGSLIEQVTLAALAGHLIVAAADLIKPDALRVVWRVNPSARASMLLTFASTLVLPLEYSIYLGVVLSLALYVYTSAGNLRVVHLVPTGDGHFREAELPASLPSRQPVLITVYGHLYFAAVRSLEEQLPPPTDSQQPVVILRLRNNQYLGSTGIRLLRRYANALHARDGRLILAGVSTEVREQLERTGTIALLGEGNVFPASDVVFNASESALAHAQVWLDATAPPPASIDASQEII